MPQYQHHHLQAWKVDGGGQVLDLDTAVKDGILGGGVAGGAIASGDALEKLDLAKIIEELESSPAMATSPESEDIPAVFICPISLQPMLDPVTLCTGQTYERPNILRWLAISGDGDRRRRPTCPTTMQELWDETIVPNLALRHLIRSWFSQRHYRMRKRAQDVHGSAAELISSLRRSKGQARLAALRELRRLAAAHPPSVAGAIAGAGALLVSLLGPFTTHAVGSEVVAIIVDLKLDPESMAALMQPARVSMVVDMLNDGTVDTKINCTKLFRSLMADAGFRPEIVSSLSLLAGILRMIRGGGGAGAAAGLSLLNSICSDHEQARGLAVAIDAVPVIVELLPGIAGGGLEAALRILGSLATSPEGRAAVKRCPKAIPALVRLLMRVSELVTELAMAVLWEVAGAGDGDEPGEFAAAAIEAGLAAKLLLVIQSGCGAALKQRSSELLKLCSLNYTASLFISKCKLTRTIQ